MGARSLSAILVLAAGLTGCAATSTVNYTLPTVQLKKRPDINTSATVQIGESLVSTERVGVIDTLSIGEEVKQFVSEDKYFVVPAGGPYFLTGVDAVGKLYTRPGILWKKANPDGSCKMDENACYENFNADAGLGDMNRVGVRVNNNSKAIDLVFTQERLTKIRPFSRQGITYQYGEPFSPPSTPTEYKRELIYSGVSGTTVSLSYREFMKDMARPAFTQELKYDLAQGRVVGFKGARFEVIAADNTSIKYKVISHLD